MVIRLPIPLFYHHWQERQATPMSMKSQSSHRGVVVVSRRVPIPVVVPPRAPISMVLGRCALRFKKVLMYANSIMDYSLFRLSGLRLKVTSMLSTVHIGTLRPRQNARDIDLLRMEQVLRTLPPPTRAVRRRAGRANISSLLRYPKMHHSCGLPPRG